MAGYIPKGSLLDNMEFQTAYSSGGTTQPVVSAAPAEERTYDDSFSFLKDKDVMSAAGEGMRSGGLSGGLMSAGLASGNPYLMGGSVILSQIEQAQKAKAAAEAERIKNEKERRSNMQGQLNAMAGMRFDI